MTLTAERLREVLDYAPGTGLFTWREPRGRAPSGAVAGTLLPTGYVAVRVDGKRYLAHRLAWLYQHGTWPAGEIDHIDGNTAHNRMENLRDVPRSYNQQNQRGAQRTNSTGLLGVSKADSTNGYRARIFVGGAEQHLGTYSTPEAAHQRYLEAKRDSHPGGTL